MPVKVKREPAPPREILVTDSHEDSLRFESTIYGGLPALKARLKVGSSCANYVRLMPADARELAAALYEWAGDFSPGA